MENKIRKVIREQIKNLAEMFPNRQGPRKANLKSMADIDNSDWSVDGGGGSIGYMEWEDGTEMTPQEIQDYFEMNHELYDDIMQGLYEGMSPEEWEAAKEKERLANHPEKEKIKKIKQMMDKEEDDKEQEEYDKGWYGESLKEASTQLGYLKEESNQYQKVTFVYTEQGGHFYGLDVYASKDQPQRSAKLKYDEANEWLKNTLEMGDDEEVAMLKTFDIDPSGPLKYSPEKEIIPRRYNSGMEDLDLIVNRLKELGIEASHGDYMDIS
jgi:hypothetical protein